MKLRLTLPLMLLGLIAFSVAVAERNKSASLHVAGEEQQLVSAEKQNVPVIV